MKLKSLIKFCLKAFRGCIYLANKYFKNTNDCRHFIIYEQDDCVIAVLLSVSKYQKWWQISCRPLRPQGQKVYPHMLVSGLCSYIYNDSLYVCFGNKLCHCGPLKCELKSKVMEDQLYRPQSILVRSTASGAESLSPCAGMLFVFIYL